MSYSTQIPPPIICTDDGWLLDAVQPPININEIQQKMIDVYAGTPAALWWSTGDHEIYQFETQHGEIIGEHPAMADQLAAQNTRHLISTNGGPLTTLVDLCRKAGLPFFPRVRMNSHYDMDSSDPGWSRFRREHPDLLIGLPDQNYPVGSIEHGIRTGLDFVHPQVRTHRAAIICELFERFDVDGVELDFMRHPAFFRMDAAYQHRHLMTDLLRHVRQRMNHTASTKGKPIQLAVRVPPTLADSARIGLDVAQWMAEELVDIVVVGGGFIPYETPIHEFVHAAQDKIVVYGCIESTRYADERNLRAIASHCWNAGARGIQLYNFYTMGPEWNKRILNQLASPQALQRLDKRYELDQTARFTTPYHCAYPIHNIEATFRYANPAAQLPVQLAPSLINRGVDLRLNVVDDLQSATADNALARCTLSLRLDDLTSDDELNVILNGKPLPWDPTMIDFNGWMRQEINANFWQNYPTHIVEVKRQGVSVEYLVDTPLLRQGENTVEVHLKRNNIARKKPVILKGVELLIEYEKIIKHLRTNP